MGPRLEYTLSNDDYSRFLVHLTMRSLSSPASKRLRRRNFFSVLLITALLGAGMGRMLPLRDPTHRTEFQVFMGLFVPGFYAGTVAVSRMTGSRRRSVHALVTRKVAAGEYGPVSGAHVAWIEEDGLFISCPRYDVLVRWAGIADFEVTGDDLYVYTSGSSGYVLRTHGIGAEGVRTFVNDLRQGLATKTTERAPTTQPLAARG